MLRTTARPMPHLPPGLDMHALLMTCALCAGTRRTSALDASSASPLLSTVRDLQVADARLRLVNTLPVPLYGTARTSASPSPCTTQTLTPMSAATQAPDPAMSTTGRRSIASSPLLPDFGAPPLSDTQRQFIARSNKQAAAASAKFVGRRAKLEPLSSAAVQTGVMGKDAARDTLYCLVLLADW